MKIPPVHNCSLTREIYPGKTSLSLTKAEERESSSHSSLLECRSPQAALHFSFLAISLCLSPTIYSRGKQKTSLGHKGAVTLASWEPPGPSYNTAIYFHVIFTRVSFPLVNLLRGPEQLSALAFIILITHYGFLTVLEWQTPSLTPFSKKDCIAAVANGPS